MAGEKVAFEKRPDDEADEKRGRSSIEFTYTDLEDAEGLVAAVHNNAGSSCSVEQLAGFMGAAARGGGFRNKITSAKSYGFIDNPRGQVVLTDLGRRLVNPTYTQAARVQAFQNVPLFMAVYNKYKGNVLPPRAALTREIQGLGVIPTQADRARQVFERSADRAGFFAHGRDRLVMPVIRASLDSQDGNDTLSAQAAVVTPPPPEKPKRGGGGGGGGDDYDPLIQGMLDRLPPLGTDWPLERRIGWLKAMAHNLEMIYGETDKSIKIEATEKERAGRTSPALGPGVVAPGYFNPVVPVY